MSCFPYRVWPALVAIMLLGGGCDEEAVRAVKLLPRFSPGKQNGRAVPVYYNVPVAFKLPQ